MLREGFCHSEQKRRVNHTISDWLGIADPQLPHTKVEDKDTQEAELTFVSIGKACFLHRKKPKRFKGCAVYLPGLAKLGLHCASIPVLTSALQHSVLKEGISKEMGTNTCFPSKGKREKLIF